MSRTAASFDRGGHDHADAGPLLATAALEPDEPLDGARARHAALSDWLDDELRPPQDLRVAKMALERIAVTAEVLDTLNSAGIDAFTVKGPIASQLLFGLPAVRSSSDIDVVVGAAAADRAESALAGIGFERTSLWRKRSGRLSVHHPLLHGVGLRRRSSMIDLHWSLGVGQPFVASALREPSIVTVAGRSLRTLPEEDHLHFISAHAVKHRWQVSKWLVDFGRVGARLGRDVQLDGARRLGIGRWTEVGFEVLDLLTGETLAKPSRRAEWTLATLARSAGDRGPRGEVWRYKLDMHDRWRDKLRVLGSFGYRMLPGTMRHTHRRPAAR